MTHTSLHFCLCENFPTPQPLTLTLTIATNPWPVTTSNHNPETKSEPSDSHLKLKNLLTLLVDWVFCYSVFNKYKNSHTHTHTCFPSQVKWVWLSPPPRVDRPVQQVGLDTGQNVFVARSLLETSWSLPGKKWGGCQDGRDDLIALSVDKHTESLAGPSPVTD